MAERFIEAGSPYVSKVYLVLWDTTLNLTLIPVINIFCLIYV